MVARGNVTRREVCNCSGSSPECYTKFCLVMPLAREPSTDGSFFGAVQHGHAAVE
jgi:hypothetical protein